MKLDDVRPGDCYARARHLLAEVALVRDELGRGEDTRALPEVTEARPRECYFEALATWHKVARLAHELGAHPTATPPTVANLRDAKPGHVLAVIDATAAQLDAIQRQLHITERAELAADTGAGTANRQPADVLVAMIRVNRELSRALERPFTPSDVYGVVALASAYATRLGATAAPAPFERRKKPQHCYDHLLACQVAVAALIGKRGETAVTTHRVPTDVLPGDVYDLASLVLGEVAFLHALTPSAQPLHAFEPAATGHRLPAHVDQLARTLAAQLATIA